MATDGGMFRAGWASAASGGTASSFAIWFESTIARPSSLVTGRAACVVASNGAPDCKAGADRLCQTKGFKDGKSLDTDASEKCSPVVYLPGHKRGPNDCKTEHFVTRALCQ